VDVERACPDPQQVPRRLADEQVVAARALQRAPQLRDLGLQGVERVAGLLPTPQVLDEPLDGHRPPLVDEEVGQQRPHLALRHPNGLALAAPHGHRPEHPEPHGSNVSHPLRPFPMTGGRAGTVRGPCAAPPKLGA
jgi:hypothetical protein